jgi:hypothetical protein
VTYYIITAKWHLGHEVFSMLAPCDTKSNARTMTVFALYGRDPQHKPPIVIDQDLSLKGYDTVTVLQNFRNN